jgi:class 3 adenylate cyclase
VSHGTRTFLFTDIEWSTALWEDRRAEMSETLRVHDQILREQVEAHEGVVFKTVGGSFYAAFEVPQRAAQTAIAAQRKLLSRELPIPIKVRMAIHTGAVEERDDDFFGPTLNRLARLLSAGHGGQILVSGATCELLQDDLPREMYLVLMGEHRLKDLSRPEQVFQLGASDLVQKFPALRTLDLVPNNLPQQATRFIGRDKELLDIKLLLDGCHLVTVLGSGGAGKTRITLQVAADALDRFAGGVWFVELQVGAKHPGTLRGSWRLQKRPWKRISIPWKTLPGLSGRWPGRPLP